MEEWKEYKLGEVGKITTGKTPKTAIKEFFDGKILFVTPADINTPYKYVSRTARYLSEEGLNSISSNSIEKGSICVSCIGNIGYVGIVDMNCASNQQINSITVNQGHDRDFIYYAIKNLWPYFKNYEGQSTTLSILNKGQFSKIVIKLPHKEIQQRIASILSALDDKIEVNRKINENLEQQAQALFKSWFVDFEPFKNGEFVESELGMIPKGWRVGQIKDICKFENGFAFKSDTYTTNGVYKVVTIKNVQDGYLDTEGANLISDIPNRMPDFCRLNTGEVLLSLTGNVGRCCLVNEDNLLLNQRVAKIKPHVESDLGYIYTLFRMPEFKERLISIARGTAQANLSPVETSKLSIVIPSTEIMKRYSVLSTDTYNKIICCMKESRLLAELRDTLLPKLMSGELKVNEIEDVL